MKYRSTPYLRFKKFKEKWQLKVLGNLGSVAMNKRIFKEETSEVGEIPFYKIGTFGREPDSFITREKFEEYKSKYPHPEIGDILISASGSIGRTVEYLGEEAYFQDSNIVWLKHDERLDNSFLKQFYSIVKWQGIEGTTIKRLYNKNILETPIALPSVSEQSAIGSLFRTLDDLLASYKNNLANYQSFKATMLSKMFPEAGQTVPEIRLDGFEGEWENKKLYEVTNITMGQSPKSENYTDNPNDYILVQGNADIKDKQVVPRLWTTEVTKMAEIGDIILTVRAPVGDIGKTDFNVVIGRGVAAIKGNDFIFYTLEKMKMTGFWNKFSTGSTFESISSNDIKEAIIQIPTLEEQRAIGSYFSNLDNLIAAHQEKISQLENLKKKLLQDMFI
jgi:type I restriction-modification system specificty subunit